MRTARHLFASALGVCAVAAAATPLHAQDDDSSMTFESKKRPKTMEEFISRKKPPAKPAPPKKRPPPKPAVAPPAPTPTPTPEPTPPAPTGEPAGPEAPPVAAKPSEPAPVTPPPPTSAPAPAPPPVAPPPREPAAAEPEAPAPRRDLVEIHFFGDVYVEYGTETPLSFGAGAIDQVITGNLGQGATAFGEVNIEFIDDNSGIVDLERIGLRWERSGFFVEAGRTHTELGFWNVAYHHGKWLQPTLERPALLSFEDDGGVLPVHQIGLTLGYHLPLAKEQRLTGILGIGNGRGLYADDIQNAKDSGDAKSILLKLELEGVGAPELRVGVSGQYDRIAGKNATARPALPLEPIHEWIANAYVAYPSETFIGIVEGYHLIHAADSGTWRTSGAFALLGYQAGLVTPYVFGEAIRTSGGTDPFFARDLAAPESLVLERTRGILGTRLDVTTWSSIKLEYGVEKVEGEDLAHLARAGWSFGL